MLASAPLAVAQEARVSGNDGQEALSTVEVWGILPPDPAEAPGAVSILDAEEIAALRPYTLHDALRFLPGVRALDDDVLGRRTGIGIRGSPTRRSRNVLLLEDGTPINASTYLDASTHYTPPTERLERVEVVKGHGQVLNGPLNNHGIVNFRSKRPTDSPETSADLVFGNQGTSRQHLMHRRTDGDVGTVFSYTRLEADGTFDVEDTNFQDFFASADWRINERNGLRLSGTYLRERSHYDESNLTPPEYDAAPRRKLGRFGQEYNTIAVDYLKFDLIHDYSPSDRFSTSTRAFVTDLDRPRFTVDPGEYEVGALPELVLVDGDGTFVPGAGGNGQMISRDRHYRGFGLENRSEYALVQSGATAHRLQWGLRVERQLFDDRRTEGEVGEILTEGNRGTMTRDETYQSTAVSAFLQDEIRRGDWSFIPGLRLEHYTQRRQRVFPTVNPREEDEHTMVLPGLSVLYTGIANTELFGSIQRGYTPATARGSDFPLLPETGINTQLGLRRMASPGFTYEAAVFYNLLQDTLVQLPYIDPETFASVFVNEADSRAWGVDLGARVDSSAWTGSALNVFAALAYNYTHATFTDGVSDGNRVPEVPLHAGSLTLGLAHSSGWQASATLTHEGRFFTDPANTIGPMLANEDGEPLGPDDAIDLREPIVLGAVDSRTLLSARVSYTWKDPDITLWVQGRNLTDRLYVLDYQNGMRPGAARTVVAGVSVTFR